MSETLTKDEIRKVIDELRGEHCELFDDGCKGSVGCCDACAVIEAIEDKLLGGEK